MTDSEWKSLGILAVVTATVCLADALSFGGETGRLGIAGIAVETGYITLPAVGAAWALLTRRLEAGRALLVVLSTAGLMAATDLLPTGGPSRDPQSFMLDSNRASSVAPAPPRWTEGGSLAIALACVRSGDCFRESDRRLASSSERFREVLAFFKLTYVATAFTTIAVARWIFLWARRSVAFLTASARQVVSGIIIWVVPALMVLLTLRFANQGLAGALVYGEAPIAIVEAHLPLVAVGLLAWLTAPSIPTVRTDAP